ncbi:MAG: NADH-dependent alcohol dehydrogenase [Bacteroidetes bacterium HGW-Bacteroidetes-9]|nr:MAG: NADH-dependent alcohol dehydrogenase [Bacteroidetes bacterium HGW-Bacteroidetes-9]
MENFTAYNPTTLHFGRNVLNQLGLTINRYGKKVLLVYGKGSIKQNGLYDVIKKQLDAIGAEVYEYSGIKSNPIVEDVDAAAAIGRENSVDVVLAVGGGSVIDSAKIISIAIPVEAPAWGFFERKMMPRTAVPLIAVLTLAATGTEMNQFAVLSNLETENKNGYGSPLIYPKHSFLDPQLTTTVPKDYTAYGVADLIAHCLEAYFGKGEDATLSDRFVFSIISEALEYGPALMEDLSNYEMRAKIMFAATMALNGMTMFGRASGEWGVHSIGHILSLLYDIPHGASLTIVYPAWLRLHREKLHHRISFLGKNLFGTEDVDTTINRLEGFFRMLDCPVRISDTSAENVNPDEIYRVMVLNKVATFVHKLTEDDYRKIINMML